MKYDVTILTARPYVNPETVTPYINNVLTEDRLVQEALEARGLKVHRTNWDNPDFDWTTTRAALIRTTWDYFERAAEFNAWLNRIEPLTQLINPIETIRWNMDKHYLLDLQAKGVHIVPTVVMETGDTRSLQQVVTDSGWQQAILKPAVSGAARHTYKLTPENIAAHEAIYRQLIAEEAMLLQPYMHHITSKGEVSHMVLGGRYSHSILKLAKSGDFRVQDDHGGTSQPYQASVEETQLAEVITATVHPLPVQARVDLLWDNNNQLALAELELLEPELWFRFNPTGADLLADAVVRVLK